MTQCASKCHETRRGLHIIFAFDARRSRWCVKYNLADRVDVMVAWMSVRRLLRECASNTWCAANALQRMRLLSKSRFRGQHSTHVPEPVTADVQFSERVRTKNDGE